jgi:sulfane dehydrogenase subunit SoxC
MHRRTTPRADLMPNGTARQFTFDMEPKSLITRPSGGDTLACPGTYELIGIASSGRGAIARVEITTDGGATWSDAALQAPLLPRAYTRSAGRGRGTAWTP